MIRDWRGRAALLLVLATAASAHDIVRSEGKIDVDGREVRLALTLNLFDLQSPNLHRNNQKLSVEELARVIPAVYQSAQTHYVVRSPAAPVRVQLKRYTLVDGLLARMEIVYEFAEDVTTLEVTSRLHEIMPPGHQHLMSVRLNGEIHEAILDQATSSKTFTGVKATHFETLWRFVRLGVEHIFTGYDHLAFLLGLLVATATIGSLVKIITSFTLAHSITLALATFNLVALPSRLTESLIAVSIAWVAAENLLDFRVMKRHYITFFFGLIHGFGFSTVLKDMELPRASLALSLFSFNAGVEIGQLTFVLLIFPLVQDLVSSGWRRLKPAVSGAVACLAVYWFVQRAFLG